MSQELSGADRRQHERYELLVQVELTRPDRSERLTVINISAGGVLLRNDRNVALNMAEHIRVRFDVPDLAPAFSIEAKVVRIVTPAAKAALVGAMWTSQDAEAGAALAELLWKLSQRR
jgi:c-di-GMP-binding flagellar brake protein YcgR